MSDSLKNTSANLTRSYHAYNLPDLCREQRKRHGCVHPNHEDTHEEKDEEHGAADGVRDQVDHDAAEAEDGSDTYSQVTTAGVLNHLKMRWIGMVSP